MRAVRGGRVFFQPGNSYLNLAECIPEGRGDSGQPPCKHTTYKVPSAAARLQAAQGNVSDIGRC